MNGDDHRRKNHAPKRRRHGLEVALLRMRAEALKGHLDGLLLAVLEAGPTHGYAVIEALRVGSGGTFDLPTGTVYPALHRLEGLGLVASTWSEGSGRKRRVYALTAAGRKALSEQRLGWQEFAGAVHSVMNGGQAWTLATGAPSTWIRPPLT
jgi:PadR family transcriptional regulator PadR